MAIHTSQNTATIINLRYNAFLGMLYVSTPESEKLVGEAKVLAGGDAVTKKGFQGNKGDSPSAKALKFLRDNGLYPAQATGLLTSARVIERDVDSRKMPYLNVGLRDGDEVYYLSVCLERNEGAQMLARKLANAEPGKPTYLSMFANMKPNGHAGHGTCLKQGEDLKTVLKQGTEVPDIGYGVFVKPLVDEALKQLIDAGIDDKDILAKRKQKVDLDFHRELMDRVDAKFTDFSAQREMLAEGDEPQTPETDSDDAASEMKQAA